jgi:nucleoside-diphosphate-sugar epimerase
MTAVAVFGASGFVGRAAVAALAAAGHRPVGLPARRLRAERAQLLGPGPLVGIRELDQAGPGAAAVEIAEELRAAGCEVVVNAAGIAAATRRATPELYGANAAWPLLLAHACRDAGVRRMVHVSTAGVQGRARRLDSSENVAPVNPYTEAKALGERLLREFAAGGDKPEVVRYRPASVHGADRPLSRSFAAFARRWPLVVCDRGDQPVPVALVGNVGAVIAALVDADGPPAVVTHPSEGYTVRSLYAAFAPGRRIYSVPERPVRGALRLAEPVGRALAPVAALSRRAELLLVGQAQAQSWLESQGFVLPYGPAELARVADSVR